MEKWKEFKRTERTIWEISNNGRLRGNGNLKKPNTNIKGYLFKSNLGLIHRIVAENFTANPENKPQVNHIDGNKLNNSFENLEWVTCQENIKHAWENKLKLPQNGEKNGASKLTEVQVLEIKKLHLKGEKSSNLAKQFNISERTLGRIFSGESWKHLN
jgi:hypothetical protein